MLVRQVPTVRDPVAVNVPSVEEAMLSLRSLQHPANSAHMVSFQRTKKPISVIVVKLASTPTLCQPVAAPHALLESTVIVLDRVPALLVPQASTLLHLPHIAPCVLQANTRSLLA